MKTILVTGAAGFIGSHLCDTLLSRGDRVVGIDNFNDYYDPAIKEGNVADASRHEQFQLHRTDIRDRDAVARIVSESAPDSVVHLAAQAGVRPSLENPNLYHEVNVIGTQNMLDACRDANVPHAVFASSSSVYGSIRDVPFRESMDVSRIISPYAATKRMNEMMGNVYHDIYGLKITFLRFFTVYGPRQRPDMAIHKFMRLIDAGEAVPMYGDGSTYRDYTYITDIVDGVMRAVDTPLDYEILNLGESQTTSLIQLIELIGDALGKTPRIDRFPMQPGDVRETFADIARARKTLAYNPSTTMEEGIRRQAAWFRERTKNAD
jgi:UDP-glucuronate 4-epimerase